MPNSIFVSLRFASAFLRVASIATLIIAIWAPSASAQTFWDPNLGFPGNGGSGVWDNTTVRWNFLNAGVYRSWSNSPDKSAMFSGTAGTVTLGDNITARNLIFDTTGYTIAGSGSNTLTLDGFGAFVDTGVGNQTISAVISGDDGLIKKGNGSLLLTGANTYTEHTLVERGTLTVGVGGSISHPAGYLLVGTSTTTGTGTLQLTGGTISSSFARIGEEIGSQGFVSVSSGTWTNSGDLEVGYDGTGSLSISGGSVIVEGQTYIGSHARGNITLSGTNGNRGILSTSKITVGNHTGFVTFDGGILQAREDTRGFIHLATRGDVTINSGGAFIDSNGFDIGIGEELSGSGRLTKMGAGTLTLEDGDSTYSGGTTVNNGTLIVDNGSISHPLATMIVGSVNGDVAALEIGEYSSGGRISNGAATLGNAAGSQGSATVTWGDWTNSGTLTVGNAGTGSLLIEHIGTVTSDAAVLGFGGTGNGSVTVDNFQNTWTNSGTLLVGRSGTGSLAVNAGLVTVEGITYTGFYGGSTGSINLSGTSGKRGTLSTNQVVERSGAGTVTFDGGILQARVDESNFISGYEPGDVTINSGGAFIDSNHRTIGISTALSGTGGLTKLGSGTLTLNGANTYSGGTTVDEGTLIQGASAAFAGGTALTVNQGGTLDLNDFDLTASSLSGTPSLGSVDLGTANLTVNQSGNTSYNGDILGTGGLIKQGSGTLDLNGSLDYTGETIISAGTLRIGGWAETAKTSNITNNASLVFHQDADGTYAGVISGVGSVTKQGTGIFTLWNANTYTGGTTISAGTLRGTASTLTGNITNNAALVFEQSNTGTFAGVISGGGSVTKQGAGALTLSGSNTYTGGTTISAGTLQVSTSSLPGNINNNASLVFQQDTTGTYTGVITGSGSVTKQGDGTLTLGGSNTYTGGTTISRGILQVSASSLTGNITNNADLAFQQDATDTYAGDISGGGTLTKQGSGTLTLSGTNNDTGSIVVNAGTLILNGTNNYTGGTVVNAGTLLQGANAAFSNNTAYTVNGGTLDLNDFDLTARLNGGTGGSVDIGTATLTVERNGLRGMDVFAGVIHGTGGLTKTGNGTLTLTGTNTYTGDTSVSVGELKLNGSASGSNFTLAGGRLSGSGTVGELTIGNDGTLAPGFSPGTLNASSTMWLSGGIFEWELNNAVGIDGINSDLLNITGGLNFTDDNPTMTIDVLSLTATNATGLVHNFDADADYSWAFITTTTGITFEGGATLDDSFEINTTGFQNILNGTFGLAQNGNNLNITYTTAVPEPGSFVMFGLVAVCGLARRRRKPSPIV